MQLPVFGHVDTRRKLFHWTGEMIVHLILRFGCWPWKFNVAIIGLSSPKTMGREFCVLGIGLLLYYSHAFHIRKNKKMSVIRVTNAFKLQRSVNWQRTQKLMRIKYTFTLFQPRDVDLLQKYFFRNIFFSIVDPMQWPRDELPTSALSIWEVFSPQH